MNTELCTEACVALEQRIQTYIDVTLSVKAQEFKVMFSDKRKFKNWISAEDTNFNLTASSCKY